MRFNLAQTPDEHITSKLIDFCSINAIDPNTDNLDSIVSFLKSVKGRVYYETFELSLNQWTSGLYQDVRSRGKLSANFIARIIEAFFKGATSVNNAEPTEYKKDSRQARKEQIIEYCKRNEIDFVKVYGYMVNNPDTDNMMIKQILAIYET